jgi:nucleotide-binding universal stress UspA family protein
MTWAHILAAIDSTPAGLHAAKVARELADSAGMKLTVMTVLPQEGTDPAASVAAVEPTVTFGIPGIEIVRMADRLNVDLLVLGRTIYEVKGEPRLGPTADQVARRSRVPCLFVPESQDEFGHHMVALDGSERGYSILEAAREFFEVTGGDLHVVTVEPGENGGGHAEAGAPLSRTLRVAGTLDKMARRNGVPMHYEFRVLRGEPVPLLSRELSDPQRDLLVVGSRRGGPAGLSLSTGVGRALLFSVQCAVLTVPL